MTAAIGDYGSGYLCGPYWLTVPSKEEASLRWGFLLPAMPMLVVWILRFRHHGNSTIVLDDDGIDVFQLFRAALTHFRFHILHRDARTDHLVFIEALCGFRGDGLDRIVTATIRLSRRRCDNAA